MSRQQQHLSPTPPHALPSSCTPKPSLYQNVPMRWNLYQKPWSSRTYLIGPHANQTVFTASFRSGWLSSRPYLILYDGASTSTERQICTAYRKGMFSDSSIIVLDRRPGAQVPAITERLTAGSSRFVFNVGRGKETHRKVFEWRPSRGKEVRTLGNSSGHKLVHLGSGRLSKTDSGSPSSRGSPRRYGQSSDGYPIVAVLAHTTMRGSKLACFHFIGQGATGEFGEEWALFVTMSALHFCWQRPKGGGAVVAGGA